MLKFLKFLMRLFSDFCSGIIWSLFPDGRGGWIQNEVFAFTENASISSFGEDVDGELYALDHINGIVYQIQPAAEQPVHTEN